MKTKKPVKIYRGPTSAVSALAVDAEGLRLVAGDATGFVRLWAVGDAKARWAAPMNGEAVAFVTFERDTVIVGTERGSVLLLDAETGAVRRQCSDVVLKNCRGAAHVHGTHAVVSGQFGWTGSTFLALDSATDRWSYAALEWAYLVGASGDTVWLRRMMSEERLRLPRFYLFRYSLHTGKSERIFTYDHFIPRAVHGATGVAAGQHCDDRKTVEFRVLEAPERLLGVALPAPLDDTQWRFSPDGSRLACGLADGGVTILDVATFTARAVDGRHTQPVTALAWSPDGTTLYSAGRDRCVRVWSGSGESIP